jgi:hypothetical protein
MRALVDALPGTTPTVVPLVVPPFIVVVVQMRELVRLGTPAFFNLMRVLLRIPVPVPTPPAAAFLAVCSLL